MTETVCPLCNMPLEERPAVPPGAADESLEDLKLKELISDIEGTVEKSIGTEGKIAESKEEEFRFDLEKALTEDISAKPESAAPAVPAGATASDYEKTRAEMEQTLAEAEQEPLPMETPSRRTAAKNMAAVLLVIGVVAAGIATGYLFSSKEPQTIRKAVPERNITPPEPAAVAKAPDVTQPAPPQPQQQEMPATVESKPFPSAAEPVKEPVAAETVRPVKQEPEPPAAEPAKAASERPPEAVPVPPVKPPEADQKALEQQPQAAPKPRMAKTPAPGSYCVNVGSFKLKNSTERVCGDLKKQGYEPTVETVTLKDGNTWYRVTVGSFATREEAGKFGRELESKTKIKPMVVKKK